MSVYPFTQAGFPLFAAQPDEFWRLMAIEKGSVPCCNPCDRKWMLLAEKVHGVQEVVSSNLIGSIRNQRETRDLQTFAGRGLRRDYA
jgi:hypothetical protein